MSEAMQPCPWCGHGGETRFDENTHWTGMRSALLSVELLHWCEGDGGMPRTIVTVRAKTKDEAIAAWNRRPKD